MGQAGEGSGPLRRAAGNRVAVPCDICQPARQTARLARLCAASHYEAWSGVSSELAGPCEKVSSTTKHTVPRAGPFLSLNYQDNPGPYIYS